MNIQYLLSGNQDKLLLSKLSFNSIILINKGSNICIAFLRSFKYGFRSTRSILKENAV